MVITIQARKGGQAKSTTAAALAVASAEEGRRTLLIDLDGQKGRAVGNAAMQLGVTASTPTFIDLFSGSEVTPVPAIKNLDMLPGGVPLVKLPQLFTEAVTTGKTLTPVTLVREAIKPLITKYDVILIDCGPAPGLVNLSALEAASVVICPLTPSAYAIPALKELREEMSRLSGPKKLFIQPVRTDSRTKMTRVIREEIGPALASAMLPEVPVLARIEELPMEGKTILQDRPNSAPANAYREAWKRIVA